MGYQQDISDIRKLANSLLLDCCFSEPPLNVDILYNYLKLTRYGQFFLDGTSWKGIVLPQKVRAILDVREQLVIINFSAHEKQQVFASVHEAGHYKIPWQKEILYICSIWDLDERTQKQFEKEANIFAAEVLFFSDLFTREANDLPFGMSSIIYLSNRYNVSLESAGRRYVEKSFFPCALLICKPIKSNNLLEAPSTELIYYHYSDKFEIRFQKPQSFSPKHVISKTCTTSGDIYSGQLSVSGKKLNFESLYTTYKVLTLVAEEDIFKKRFV